ncbi:MAG: hypothetical protein JST53_05945 [Actinobacteria bacterium]|nr:hypothetical protein [Actinomycetota bacterium]
MRTARNAVGIFGALVAIALAFAAFGASSASAIGIAKWEAGTCATTTCTYESPPGDFFPQAAGHPPAGVTDFTVNASGESDQAKRVKVELPQGLNVNPQATPQCPVDTFKNNDAECGTLGSEVGVSEVTSTVLGLPIGPLKFPVYNLQPNQGEPALFGFHVKFEVLGIGLISEFVYLETSIEWAGDYHESFYINNIAAFPPLGRNRLVFNGQAGGTGAGGAFLTLPSPCNGPTTSTLELENQSGATTPNTPTTPALPFRPVPIIGCSAVPFAPSVTAAASGTTDSSSTITVSLNNPQHLGAKELNSSTVKSANVTLPVGTGLNPATAPGLKFCPDAAFPLRSKAPVTCSAETQIGTIAIEAPALPAGSLKGPVYLAEQKSRDPQSGQEYRIFFNAESPRYGVQVREEGKVKANPTTGQLTAEFTELPQVGFSSATLTFGSTAKHAIPVLSSPPLCSQTATSTAVPYSTGAVTGTPPTELKLTQAPGGGPCAKTMGERPFSPGVVAKPNTAKAATYTPFQLQVTRPEGQQEIKGFNLTLPPGATANISNVPYCEANEYNRAAGRSGVEERKNSSCNPKSEIGSATIEAGTGNTPLKIEGKVFLSGPYRGAPLSAVVITPAVAGPFDLGNVVVVAPLNLNPESGQIETSAEILDVFGGAKLDIRSIQVSLKRKEFTLNGTNCNKNATVGSIAGGGGDPTNSAAWSQYKVSVPFQGEGCEGLEFTPGLKVRLFGQTKRAKHPKLKATLTTQEGQANTQLASVALPHAIFLDQASLGTVCTRPQFAAGQCPAKSRYGFARAWTPLLSHPVEGPVYLRSSNNTLPDMVADLKGQVNIVLDGKIDSFKGGIRTTFANLPDLPVSKFVLNLPGGKHGLLQASTNLCAKPVKGIVRLVGQNGKKVSRHPRIQTPCKNRHPKKHHKRKHGKKAKPGKHKQGSKKNKGGAGQKAKQ